MHHFRTQNILQQTVPHFNQLEAGWEMHLFLFPPTCCVTDYSCLVWGYKNQTINVLFSPVWCHLQPSGLLLYLPEHFILMEQLPPVPLPPVEITVPFGTSFLLLPLVFQAFG